MQGGEQHDDQQQERQTETQQQGTTGHILRSTDNHLVAHMQTRRIRDVEHVDDLLFRLCRMAYARHLAGGTGRGLKDAHSDTILPDRFNDS